MSKFTNADLESESDSELESDTEELLRKINSNFAYFEQVKK